MNRSYYLQLARSGLRMPIGADLVLHERQDPEAILLDPARLAEVVVAAARSFGTPLAIPHMDLQLEKTALLSILGVPESDAPKYHLSAKLSPVATARFEDGLEERLHPKLRAHNSSVWHVGKEPDVLPIGMSIGPFSLMSKLLVDPIMPVAMAGSGLTAKDDEDISLLEQALDLSTRFVLRTLRDQLEAGARAVFIAEPAANKVYLSPRQIAAGSDIFERYVMLPNQRIKGLLDEFDADLFFHCCGELVDSMIESFGRLDPAILSLGSSRNLWEDARLVSDQTVLYGNLPSKRFYADDNITVDEVERMAIELLAKMEATGHPFILGTECDVLSVPGCHDIICKKVRAFMCAEA